MAGHPARNGGAVFGSCRAGVVDEADCDRLDGWTGQEANDMRGMPPGRIAGPGELFLYSFLCHLTLKGDGKPHTFRLRLSKEMKTNNRPFSAAWLRGELWFFYRLPGVRDNRPPLRFAIERAVLE